jgi:hypothetical protein
VTGGVITTFAGGGTLQSNPAESPFCAAYPAGFVPFTSLFSLSNPNSEGDQLLMGDPANYQAIENLPIPTAPNQQYCESGERGCFEPSNFSATSLRYQPKSCAHVVSFVFNLHHRKPQSLCAFEYFDYKPTEFGEPQVSQVLSSAGHMSFLTLRDR